MASRISNQDLLERCREVIVADPAGNSLDQMIKNALITAVREINHLDSKPMAWCRGSYDALFTRASAAITAVTQADPGVFTAESLDTDITGHGFSDDDIVFMDGLSDDSMDELNHRFFRLHYVGATTFYLHTLDGSDNISTASLDAWSSGGYIYHCGVIIPHSTIQPSTGETYQQWIIEDVHGVTFDSEPADPISEEEVLGDEYWMTPRGTPERWRYWRHDYQTFDPDDVEHFLLFYPPTAQDHNIRLFYQKGYPDLDTWTTAAYPPLPADIHDCVWHRALALLATNAEKQRRESKEGRLMGKIEVLYAQHWKEQTARDEIRILELNRKMLGTRPSRRGFTA